MSKRVANRFQGDSLAEESAGPGLKDAYKTLRSLE
jgi:hypothetical protein